MSLLCVFAVCFSACIAGAICGIGGGVIIKPVLDALGILDVASISFLSGCTVLSMTAYSVLRSRLNGSSHVDRRTGVPLALGASMGGVIGKELFQSILTAGPDANMAGAVQAGCLLLVTAGTLLYVIRKDNISTHTVKNRAACAAIGLALGLLSAFLGIGGGPVNLVVLFFFFSMDTKTAAENSLYIILYSQTASLAASLITRTVPACSPGMLCLMISGGICGGICGRYVNRRLSTHAVDRLFLGLMSLMILLSLYNLDRFLHPA